MQTNKLKTFATEARNILMLGVKQRLLSLGFGDDGTPKEMPERHEGGATFQGRVVTIDFYDKWTKLNEAIRRHTLRNVAEEAAYTWFNRLVCIRILVRNGLAAPVLEYEADGSRLPMLVADARQGRLPAISDETVRQQLAKLLQDDRQTAEQFRLLITAYCHSNPIINACFGQMRDYTELLLPQNILAEGGFVDMLNHDDYITPDDYRSSELIGWLYQFYISERKDEVFAKKEKYTAEEIPAATQIFTPNWIVKYMVQNSLGRIYVDENPYCELKDNMPYLVGSEKKVASFGEAKQLEDLRVADLACGSGHILGECFELLYSMYMEEGYSRRQAIESIFQNNLLGIDLDTRAKQLAQFALLLKACQKDESFADAHCLPHVLDMPAPYAQKDSLRDTLPHFLLGGNVEMVQEISDAITLMDDAQTLGSIMQFCLSERTRNAIAVRMDEYHSEPFVPATIRELMPYMEMLLALTDEYDALVMNPPYMGSGNMNAVLSDYVKKHYAEGKSDLFAVFMQVCEERLREGGRYAMINMQSWMFLSSFEALRRHVLSDFTIESMLHLGPRTFDELSGEVVQNTAFVVCKQEPTSETCGTYYRLVDGKDCADKEQLYLSAASDGNKIYYPNVPQKNFEVLNGSPISFWISPKVISIIQTNKAIGTFSEPRAGLQTSDNNRFLRHWYEVSKNNEAFNLPRNEALNSEYRWFPHNKGGEKRKWYGNRLYVVNFFHDGEELKYWLEHNPKDPTTKSWSRNLRNYPLYFKEGITWSAVGNKSLNFRFTPQGSTFDTSGPMLFASEHLEYILALSNTKIMLLMAKIFAQGLSIGSGHIAKIPYICKPSQKIDSLVEENISISKEDWDAHETSWDFDGSPLLARVGDCGANVADLDMLDPEEAEEIMQMVDVPTNRHSLADVVLAYKHYWDYKFNKLHKNEEELNREFIRIYGLQDELTPDVPLNEITILQQGEISIEKEALLTDEGNYVLTDEDGNALIVDLEQPEIEWHDDVIIKQLLSYAVGCMMGRYSIDKPRLILASQGEGVKEYNERVPDSRFEVDDDGIIPVMSADCEFTDNVPLRIKTWLAVVFGEEKLNENLNYIEAALGKSIADYFQKDFWKDHKKMYQNRPIYWLFASKKGAFQVIAYMHRMDAYTPERIRTKYLLPHIEHLVNLRQEMEANQANLSTRERKQLDTIVKQIAECREYHDRLHTIADLQQTLNLDDGVLVNYAKLGDVVSKLK